MSLDGTLEEQGMASEVVVMDQRIRWSIGSAIRCANDGRWDDPLQVESSGGDVRTHGVGLYFIRRDLRRVRFEP